MTLPVRELERSTVLLIGKPSISIRVIEKPCLCYINNQRVYIYDIDSLLYDIYDINIYIYDI